jgi:hypothetical protein
MASPKRTRLRAVHLTDSERDLIVHALDTLCDQIRNTTTSGQVLMFARTHTAARIAAARELFADKVASK